MKRFVPFAVITGTVCINGAKNVMRIHQTNLQFLENRNAPVAPGKRRRQRYSLAEKVAIVLESQQPGARQASVTQRYNLGKNVLWSWRKALLGVDSGVFDAMRPAEREIEARLEARIAELERLVGQKTMEIERLKTQLQGKR